MSHQLTRYDPRQEMSGVEYEIQHKRDTYLKNVELHHHDFFEIYYLVSGDVNYVIEGRYCRVMPGDLLLISPRELHQVSIKPDMAPYERYVLWISADAVHRLSSPATDLELGLNPLRKDYNNLIRLTPEQRITVRNLMEALYQESGGSAYGSELMQEHLTAQLLVQINRLAQLHASDAQGFVASSQIVSDVVEYVNLHYSERLTLDLLADQFFISKYHLSHEFQRHMGTSVYRYIQKKRLQIARYLLSQGEAPSNVSSLCGFTDYAGFYRAFTAEYGTAPREFAASIRHEEPDVE